MNHTDLGTLGEFYVARMLAYAGLAVEMGGPADLLVEGMPVEVKAARRGTYRSKMKTWSNDQGYQFCLRRDGHTEIRAPVVILLCYNDLIQDPVAFIIPSQKLGRRRKVTIPGKDPKKYAGQWCKFREAWIVCADELDLHS